MRLIPILICCLLPTGLHAATPTGAANWTASGTTNSTLRGIARANEVTATNGITLAGTRVTEWQNALATTSSPTYNRLTLNGATAVSPSLQLGDANQGFYREGSGIVGVSASGRKVAYFRARTLNGDDNTLMQIGSGAEVNNEVNNTFTATIAGPSLNQTGDSEYIFMNIGTINVTSLDTVTKTGQQCLMEFDKLTFLSASPVTYDRVANSRFRFHVAEDNVTLIDSVGIDFVIPNDAGGFVSNYKCINIPTMTGGAGTNFYGMYFNNEPNGGSLASAASTDINIAPGSGGFFTVNNQRVDSDDIQVFTATGANTWTKPSGAKTVTVTLVGAGGGGGSGRKGGVNTVRCAGGGGAGGGYTTVTFAASFCGGTETVTVGAGGGGGASQTTDSTDGNAGTAGTASSFGTWASAQGGGAGGGGTATAGTAGGTALGFLSGGGAAAASATGGAGANGSGVFIPPSGGASGGGVTSGNAVSNGGTGGVSRGNGTLAGGTAGTAGGNGGNGGSATANFPVGGSGGGGGASSITTNAGNGGNGGTYGGGGGGGGASLDATGNSGAGGTGGNGIVVVITSF